MSTEWQKRDRKIRNENYYWFVVTVVVVVVATDFTVMSTCSATQKKKERKRMRNLTCWCNPFFQTKNITFINENEINIFIPFSKNGQI